MKNLTKNEINLTSGGLQCLETSYVDIVNTSDSSILFRIDCTPKHDGQDKCAGVMKEMQKFCDSYNKRQQGSKLQAQYNEGCINIV